MTTSPFDRWRAATHQPGTIPDRAKLAKLAPDLIVGVRAGLLLELVMQAENHEPWTTT